jgi:GNAT superfamily N-acetyltransferase
MNETQVLIRPGRESDAISAREAVNSVAAEKWYLATVDGFSLEQTRAFLKLTSDGCLPQVLAVVVDQVVGFCDILPNTAKGFTHVGRLGMGVRSEWRRLGIGHRLLDAGLSLAHNAGLEKVELEVPGPKNGGPVSGHSADGSLALSAAKQTWTPAQVSRALTEKRQLSARLVAYFPTTFICAFSIVTNAVFLAARSFALEK